MLDPEDPDPRAEALWGGTLSNAIQVFDAIPHHFPHHVHDWLIGEK